MNVNLRGKPTRLGINRRISEESLMALFSCSFVTQRGLIGEDSHQRILDCGVSAVQNEWQI